MNSPDSFDAELKALLSPEKDLIGDAGFSQRVVQSLSTPRSRAWLRYVLVLGMSVLGCVVGLFLLPSSQAIQGMLSHYRPFVNMQPIHIAAFIFAYFICSVVVALALQDDREQGQMR